MLKFLTPSQGLEAMRCLSLAGLLLLAASAMAADDKTAKALQRAQQKAQMLEQEKNQWLSEKSQLQDDLRKSQETAERLKSSSVKLGSAQKELSGVQEDKQRLSTELEALKAELTELKGQYGVAQQTSQQLRTDLNFSQQSLIAKSKGLVTCENNNLALYELNSDLLLRYEQAYKSAYLLKGGVFTQLGLVNLENQAQSDRDKLRGLLAK